MNLIVNIANMLLRMMSEMIMRMKTKCLMNRQMSCLLSLDSILKGKSLRQHSMVNVVHNLKKQTSNGTKSRIFHKHTHQVFPNETIASSKFWLDLSCYKIF